MVCLVSSALPSTTPLSLPLACLSRTLFFEHECTCLLPPTADPRPKPSLHLTHPVQTAPPYCIHNVNLTLLVGWRDGMRQDRPGATTCRGHRAGPGGAKPQPADRRRRPAWRLPPCRAPTTRTGMYGCMHACMYIRAFNVD